MDVPSEPLGDFYWRMILVTKGFMVTVSHLATDYSSVDEIKHLHVSDRWRHGCRR